ncbi:Protein phosphatase 2C 2 [Lobosporangium transversale]|nr:Protein phosphatase 2C 2 [Lobosporangium transversale]
MGQILSAPVTEKHSTCGKNERFAYGASAMQGWRTTMDDAHTTLLAVESTEGIAFFAVYDGHGGSEVARICSKDLHKKIISEPTFVKGDLKSAFKDGFLTMDQALRDNPEARSKPSGCTAITAMINNENILYVGNLGDSRAILSCDGKFISLSHEHKPDNIDESIRINNAGGYVSSGRVNGSLALSRAFGDFDYKSNEMLDPDQQIVIAIPDVMERELTEKDEFMVLACDGAQRVVDFVRNRVVEKVPLETICERLMDQCLPKEVTPLNYTGTDNMTMIIVAFLNGRTLEEWYENIIQRATEQARVQRENVKSTVAPGVNKPKRKWFFGRFGR